MKKYGYILLSLLIIVFVMGIVFSFMVKNTPPRVFVVDKEVRNNGDYIIMNNKIFVSADALNRDFGFNVFYDKPENIIRLIDSKRLTYKAKSDLCIDFAEKYDPKNPDQVAEIWAEGVKGRNGVFQYAVLSKELKSEFKQLLDETGRSGWVTGFSSPWVQGYSITKEKVNDSTWKYTIVFNAVSVGKIHDWKAVITIGLEDDKWRILKIDKNFDIM